MRILVTGSREWTDRAMIEEALISLTRGLSWHKVTVIHGGARGADLIADQVAHDFDMQVEVHPADWEMHGKAAGPIRNQEMVDAGADVCVAFFHPDAQNRGTSDCAARAAKAGIPVKRYPEGGTHEPSGAGPDSPPANESRVPGATGKYQAVENHPDDSWRIEHLVPF